MNKFALVTIVALQLAGCGGAPAYDQDISGTLTRGGQPASTLRVRFLSSETQEICGDSHPETVTDSQGSFRLKLQYKPSWFERIDVVIHPFRLCVLEGNDWRSLWNLTTGPAPRRVEFLCSLDATSNSPCEVSWDGQPMRALGQ